jgi:hypothetical protein
MGKLIAAGKNSSSSSSVRFGSARLGFFDRFELAPPASQLSWPTTSDCRPVRRR